MSLSVHPSVYVCLSLLLKDFIIDFCCAWAYVCVRACIRARVWVCVFIPFGALGDGVMRVSHFVLHAFIHMTAITMIPFAVLTALIFYMVSTVGATFTDFLLILLVNLTANGTDVAIVILICVTIPTYATPIAHVVCAYVTFFEGFLYPVPDIHEAIRVGTYGACTQCL